MRDFPRACGPWWSSSVYLAFATGMREGVSGFYFGAHYAALLGAAEEHTERFYTFLRRQPLERIRALHAHACKGYTAHQ